MHGYAGLFASIYQCMQVDAVLKQNIFKKNSTVLTFLCNSVVQLWLKCLTVTSTCPCCAESRSSYAARVQIGYILYKRLN